MKSTIALLGLALLASGAAFAQDLHAAVKGIITSSVADDEKLVGALHSGESEGGDSDTVSVRIDPSKTYMIYATCDFHCINLYISVTDGDGADVAGDYSDDDAPVIPIWPGDAGNELNIRIDMADCGADSCVWALGVYEQP